MAQETAQQTTQQTAQSPAAQSSEALVRQAQARGLLPADALRQLPPHASPSWVVAGLSFIGAQLVLLPLIGLLAAISYELLLQGWGAIAMSALLLGAGVALLRGAGTSMFVQQLAFSALVAGLVLWAIGGGLFLGEPMGWRLDALLLQCIALALLVAALVRQDWVQRLLGMGATVLALLLSFGDESLYALAWVSELGPQAYTLVPLVLLWAAWCALEPRLGHWRSARLLGNLADGAGVALLLSVIWMTGRTYLGATVFGLSATGSAEVDADTLAQLNAHLGGWLQAQRHRLMQWALLLGGGAWLIWHWRLRWPHPAMPLLALALLALLAGGWAMPYVGVVGLMGIVALGTGRRRTLWLAALALLAGLSGFYYALHWPLQQKAAWLAAVGAGVALGLGLLRPRRAAVGAGADMDMSAPVAPHAWQRWGAVAMTAAGVLALGLVQWDVRQKEQVIAHGQKLFVALAPVDPRSLMQGDYMALRFALPADVREALDAVPFGRTHALAQASLDARGVAEVTQLHTPGQPVPAGRVLLPLKQIKGHWTLVTDAYFFPEGQGKPFTRARFGEFRALPDGRALLVGLADKDLQAIQAAALPPGQHWPDADADIDTDINPEADPEAALPVAPRGTAGAPPPPPSLP